MYRGRSLPQHRPVKADFLDRTSYAGNIDDFINPLPVFQDTEKSSDEISDKVLGSEGYSQSADTVTAKESSNIHAKSSEN